MLAVGSGRAPIMGGIDEVPAGVVLVVVVVGLPVEYRIFFAIFREACTLFISSAVK